MTDIERRKHLVDERKARIRAYNNARYSKPEVKEWHRNYRIQHRKERLAYQRKHRYGLSEIDFDNMMKIQGGTCAICGGTEWGKRGPSIDHNHSSGKVRGILCNRCNLVLGLLEKSPIIISRMFTYMVTHNG